VIPTVLAFLVALHNWVMPPSPFDRVAQCESNGNWSSDTGNGYFGGLQMDTSFWESWGGYQYAARPDLASRTEQIAVAMRARDGGLGYSPWPYCGRFA
jgi:hypothetical protein